jgi:DNA-binding MarR family transcriptional regulator
MPNSQSVEQVRRFSRFYTKQIGVLSAEYLDSPFTVSEARVIYELAQQKQATATELAGLLGIDAGQLSRILGGLKRQGVID